MKKLIEELRGLVEQDEKDSDNGNGKGSETEQAIQALRDTDYRDKEAFFKMVQLLKGLAVASGDDKLAQEFLSKVSDELTDVAEELLGDEVEEGVLGEGKKSKDKEISQTYYKYFSGIQVNMMDIPKIYKEIEALLLSGENIDDKMAELVKKYKA